MKNDYINNKDFYALLVKYRKACTEAENGGDDRPKIPEKIGKCFYMIATRLSNKANFIGYTYKEEMVSDALENCVMAIHNFDPDKSKNPFAYFTQIVWYAFLRRIEKEKRQTYIKYKSLEQAIIEEGMSDELGGAYVNFDITNDKMKPIIERYETKKKKKKKPKGVEKFIKDDK